jgi:phospholipid-binding lipoprotein MlaA
MFAALLLGVFSAPELKASQDPLESINRPIFVLNDNLDRYALRPLAKGYDYVMPAAAQRGVSNFFANLYDVTSALNAVLQWRWEGAAQSGSRFMVNSTLGVVGLFDVATPLGIRPYRTDFGQTLALWGIPEGPYLMLPLFGPRTFRSGTATLVDTFSLSVPPYLDSRALRNSIWGLELVHGRARLLESDELISGDRYIFVRDAYLQQRSAFVNDGEIVDDFSDFEDAWEDEAGEGDPWGGDSWEQEPLEGDGIQDKDPREKDPWDGRL